jgi:alpha-glucosidase
MAGEGLLGAPHHDLVAAPHHDGSPAYVRTPAGLPVLAPTLGDRVRVAVEVPDRAGVDSVHVRVVRDREPFYGPAVLVAQRVGAQRWEAEVEVANPITRYRFVLDGTGGLRWLTQVGVHDHDVTDVWDFALVATPPPPAWSADAVLYQIFPDRFARGGASAAWPAWAERSAWDAPVATDPPASMRQLYGGDLPGITAHLDHLVDLGVTGFYLNPFFPAPQNHRYCASGFDHVDPFLGGDDALAALSAAAHERGLRVLGDLTLNHSGDTHPWFRRALEDPTSEEAGFYAWRDRDAGAYQAWLGVPTLPKFDHRSPELRRRLYEGPDSVASRWLRPPFDLDGWRVDAANMAGRLGDVDRSHDLQRNLLATMREARPDAYLLAEHCHDATDDLQGDGWHGTMDYLGFTDAAWGWLQDPHGRVELLGVPYPLPRRSGPQVVRALRLVRGQLPWRSVVHSLSLLGSHDTARWAHTAGDRDRRHVGIAWCLTFVGIPSVYYGDEIGLDGADNETGREPMPWADPGRWDADTLDWTRRLIALRRTSVALRHGGLRWLHVGEDVLVYLRPHPDEQVLVQLARAATDRVVLDAETLGIQHGGALLDHDDLVAQAGRIELPGSARATARAWRLPGSALHRPGSSPHPPGSSPHPPGSSPRPPRTSP